jgi:hypothetical protein
MHCHAQVYSDNCRKSTIIGVSPDNIKNHPEWIPFSAGLSRVRTGPRASTSSGSSAPTSPHQAIFCRLLVRDQDFLPLCRGVAAHRRPPGSRPRWEACSSLRRHVNHGGSDKWGSWKGSRIDAARGVRLAITCRAFSRLQDFCVLIMVLYVLASLCRGIRHLQAS